MELTEIRRGLLMQMAVASNVQKGTFVGNGTNLVDISCPFEPDIIHVWTTELESNPGGTGGLVCTFMHKGYGYTSFRWASAGATGISVGGVKNAPNNRYSNGILSIYTQSQTTSFIYVQGKTYEYALIKL